MSFFTKMHVRPFDSSLGVVVSDLPQDLNISDDLALGLAVSYHHPCDDCLNLAPSAMNWLVQGV
jgi:hypothetical protein